MEFIHSGLDACLSVVDGKRGCQDSGSCLTSTERPRPGQAKRGANTMCELDGGWSVLTKVLRWVGEAVMDVDARLEGDRCKRHTRTYLSILHRQMISRSKEESWTRYNTSDNALDETS